MNRSDSFSLKREPSTKLDPDSFGKWVLAFCIIRFDLEQGQVIEECYPPNCLTQDEELEIAFSSFPDSVSQHHNRSSIHDSIFFFRFQRYMNSNLENVSSSKRIKPEERDNNNGANLDYLYGYVFNRQRHDERLKRGGEQKSVVILSTNPYSNVFRPLLQIMGPLYFDIGKKALEYLAAHVSLWPSPLNGKLMELPIGNASLKVYLPPSHSLPLKNVNLIEESASSIAPFLPTNQSVPQGLFHDSDIFGTFRGILLQLWELWELVLIGEPILVIAPTPPQCSEAVACLVSLVAPLLSSVDFRPYFTIHNPEFVHLNSLQEGKSFPPMVLGVTNLFFLKALRNIPHIVSIGNPNSRASSGNRLSITRQEGFGIKQLSLKKFSPSSLLSAAKLRRDGPLCLMTEHKEALWSTYNTTTKPDTSVLNRLVDAGISPRIEESMSVVNNEILRRHFLELTTNFLAPFGPYFRAITPSQGISPYTDPPALPLFNADEFIASLSARGPGKFLSKRMRSNWLDLYRITVFRREKYKNLVQIAYMLDITNQIRLRRNCSSAMRVQRRFLKGHNFMPWFQRRRAVAEEEQHRLWRQARMKTEVQEFISKMTELEIVDSFNTIERRLLGELRLQQSGTGSEDSEAECQKLKGDLKAVFTVLPKDMQQSLLLNPQKASLLLETFE